VSSCRYLKSSVVIYWLDGSLLELDHSLFALHLLWLGELFVDVGADAGTYSLLAAKLARSSMSFRWFREDAQRFFKISFSRRRRALSAARSTPAGGIAACVSRFIRGFHQFGGGSNWC
jgi:hypothetical protein